MSKKSKSVSKAASVLASDDSSPDALSLAGSVLSTSDDDEKAEPLVKEPEPAAEFPVYEPEEEPLVRFQDEAPALTVESEEILGTFDPSEPDPEFAPDLADSESLDEFPVMSAAELEDEGFGKVIEIGPEPEPEAEPVPDHIVEAVAAAQEAQGHVAVTPNVNRD